MIDCDWRILPDLLRFGDEVYPSVALEVIRVAVGDPSYQVKAGQGGVIALRVPKFKTIKTLNKNQYNIKQLYVSVV